MVLFRLFLQGREPGDATGAYRSGGRWNSPGTAVLYSASSLSLACLEILVHIRRVENLPEYSYSELEIQNRQVHPWDEAPARTLAILESQELSRERGDDWIERRRKVSARGILPQPLPVLQVPSAVVPQEWNYLIDPNDWASTFPATSWSRPKPFRIDPRLVDPDVR
jgi:RES domain-containing protein